MTSHAEGHHAPDLQLLTFHEVPGGVARILGLQNDLTTFLTQSFAHRLRIHCGAELCTAASRVTLPGKPLTVVLDRLEVWQKSNALVLTPEDAPAQLMRLSYALEQAMLPFGQDQERKEFRPHLTLTRDYRAQVPEADSQPAFVLRADRFALYESHKGQYRVIADWPLVLPAEAG